MAQVDFSNAILDVAPTNVANVICEQTLALGYGSSLYDNNQTIITSDSSFRVLTKTNSKVTYFFQGKFNTNGTECYIYNGYYMKNYWRISNISFSSGDSYSFTIDVEIKVIT